MKKKHAIYLVILAAIILVILFSSSSSGSSKKYDEFAECLEEEGAVFYGAFWCPHCNTQKEMFENSKEIPYVECSTSNRQGQTAICVRENIQSYPTWKFADGSVQTGAVPLERLAEKTGCMLPE